MLVWFLNISEEVEQLDKVSGVFMAATRLALPRTVSKTLVELTTVSGFKIV